MKGPAAWRLLKGIYTEWREVILLPLLPSLPLVDLVAVVEALPAYDSEKIRKKSSTEKNIRKT